VHINAKLHSGLLYNESLLCLSICLTCNSIAQLYQQNMSTFFSTCGLTALTLRI